MSRKQIDQLIICSPYREPNEHWRQDEDISKNTTG